MSFAVTPRTRRRRLRLRRIARSPITGASSCSPASSSRSPRRRLRRRVRRRLEAGRRPADDQVGQGGHARERLAGIPAAAAGPQGLAEPQRPVGLRDHRRRTPRKPEKWDGQILVPFCVESALSGVGKTVTPDQNLWYRRTFEVPAGWKGKRVLLHFGAVDWEATVFVNGKELGTHHGGYDPFTFDITDALKDGRERAGRPRLGPDRRRQPAARQAGQQARTASGTRRSPASGRRCGWSRCRTASHHRPCRSRPTSTRAKSSVVRWTSSGTLDGDVGPASKSLDGDKVIVESRASRQAVPHQGRRTRSSGRPTSPHLYDVAGRASAANDGQAVAIDGRELLRHAQDLRRQGRARASCG